MLFRSSERQQMIDWLIRSDIKDGGAGLDERTWLGRQITRRVSLHMSLRLDELQVSDNSKCRWNGNASGWSPRARARRLARACACAESLSDTSCLPHHCRRAGSRTGSSPCRVQSRSEGATSALVTCSSGPSAGGAAAVVAEAEVEAEAEAEVEVEAMAGPVVEVVAVLGASPRRR